MFQKVRTHSTLALTTVQCCVCPKHLSFPPFILPSCFFSSCIVLLSLFPPFLSVAFSFLSFSFCLSCFSSHMPSFFLFHFLLPSYCHFIFLPFYLSFVLFFSHVLLFFFFSFLLNNHSFSLTCYDSHGNATVFIMMTQ